MIVFLFPSNFIFLSPNLHIEQAKIFQVLYHLLTDLTLTFFGTVEKVFIQQKFWINLIEKWNSNEIFGVLDKVIIFSRIRDKYFHGNSGFDNYFQCIRNQIPSFPSFFYIIFHFRKKFTLYCTECHAK